MGVRGYEATADGSDFDQNWTEDVAKAVGRVTNVALYPASYGSYLIFLDGSTYYARNGRTGVIDDSNATLLTLTQAVNDLLHADAGGIIYLKELEDPTTVLDDDVQVVEDYQGRRRIHSNQGKVMSCPLLAADPATGGWGASEEGYNWYNTTSHEFKFWNGTAVKAWPVVGGGDADAIHDNVAAEISAIAEKVAPIAADLVIIEDSAAANVKKKVQLGNLPSIGDDPDAIHDDEANEISALAAKAVPVSDDILIMEDSAAAYVKKKVLISSLPAAGGTYKLAYVYTIYKSGANYIAMDEDGNLDFSGADADTVINAVFAALPADGGTIILKGAITTDGTINQVSNSELIFDARASITYSGAGAALSCSNVVEFSIVRPNIVAASGTCIYLDEFWKFEILRPYLTGLIGIDMDRGNTGFIGGGGSILESGNDRTAGTVGIRMGTSDICNQIEVGVNRIGGFEAGIEVGDSAWGHLNENLYFHNGDYSSNTDAMVLHNFYNVKLENMYFEDNRSHSIVVDDDGSNPSYGLILDNICFREVHANCTHLIHATRLGGLDWRLVYKAPANTKPCYIGSRQLYWSGVAQPQPNLLLNGDCEAFTGDELDSWTENACDTAEENTEIKEGTSSVAVTSGGIWSYITQAVARPVAFKGKWVSFGAWVYAPTTNDQVAGMGINDGVFEGMALPLADEWRWYWHCMKVDDAAAALNFTVYSNYSANVDNDDVIYVDGLRAVQGTTVSPVYETAR